MISKVSEVQIPPYPLRIGVKIYTWLCEQIYDSVKWRRLNGWLVIFWALMLLVSVFTGWLNIVAYVALLSIYANFAAHLGVWAASRAEAASAEVHAETAKVEAESAEVTAKDVTTN